MSGETAKEESAWTMDSLRYHVDQRFVALEKMLDERYATQTKAVEKAFAAADLAVQAALTSAEKAVAKAEASSDKRFDSVNAFRQTLTDQAARFMTRGEHEAVQVRNDERYQGIADRLNRGDGERAGVKLSTGVLVSVISVAVLVLGVVIAFANYVASR